VLAHPTVVSVRRYRGHRGRDTYLEYEGTVSPPGGDIEDVPFYTRCAVAPVNIMVATAHRAVGKLADA